MTAKKLPKKKTPKSWTKEYSTLHNQRTLYSSRYSSKRYYKKKKNHLSRVFGKKYIFEYKDEFYMVRKLAADQLPISLITLKMYMSNTFNVIPKPIYFRKIKVPGYKLMKEVYGVEYVQYLSQTQVDLIRKVIRACRGNKKKIRHGGLKYMKEYLHDNWTRYEKNLGAFSKDGDCFEE